MNISFLGQRKLSVGSREFNADDPNLIILHFNFSGGGSKKTTGRLFGESSGYQVPTGKSLVIECIKAEYNDSAATALAPVVAYSDNDVGYNGTTALTNAVYAKAGGIGSYIVANVSDPAAHMAPMKFTVPTGKYVTLDNTVSAGFLAIGRLV